MDQKRYQQLKLLVDQALDLPEFERDVFLQQECGANAALLAEARDLLLHYRNETSSDSGPEDGTAKIPPMIGRRIGAYQILEIIGEGGMGVVYLAGQSAPLRRKVALKVIKLGMDTRHVIARFESERQALALMDHSNIAKVLDAGSTEEGRPFFVMEYIQGVSLNQYCDEKGLGLPQRLDLFIQVCRGVQHAHQKGIIHRDLKPGNILVTEIEGNPVPKIIDFGVAKATSHHLAVQTLFTQQGQMIGTPEYMSPEQAGSGLADVDTRSDVYSLGVLLYELLTGVLPLERKEIMRAGLERMVLFVQNEIPPKPSTRIDTEAQTRADPATLYGGNTGLWAKRLRGDLDWITMKALEKEPERRYDTPAEFAADLERHLKNQPVDAGPPSTWYRAQKFVQRNRAAVAIAMTILITLIAGVIGTSVGLVRSRLAEAEALAAAKQAEGLTLYQMSLNEKNFAKAFPFILGALERDDRSEYRLQAKRLLLERPPYWRLPGLKNVHNPKDVDISPDGKWMAIGWSREGKIQLYSFAGGEPRVVSEQQGPIHRMRFTEDSKYLVTAAWDSTVCVWSPEDGRLVKKWDFPGVANFFIDNAGNQLLVMVDSGETMAWQAVSLEQDSRQDLGSISGMEEGFRVRAHPDLDPTRRWLVQPMGNRLDVYEVDKLGSGPVRTIGHHGEGLLGVTVSPDGQTVISYDEKGGVAFWDFSASDSKPTRRVQGYEAPIQVRFDQSGKLLIVSGFGGMRVWNLDLSEAVEPLDLNSPIVWTFSGAVHPSGNWMVTVNTFGIVAAWPLKFETSTSLKITDSGFSALGFSPDGKHLIAGTSDGAIWDIPLKGKSIGEPELLHFQEGFGFQEVSFDDQSRQVFLPTCNSVAGGRTVSRLDLETREMTIFDGFTCDIVVDGEGRYIASSADPGCQRDYVWIYDSLTGEGQLLDHEVGGFTLATGFTRDSRLLVCGSQGVGLWDLVNNQFESIAEDVQEGWLGLDRQSILLISPEGSVWKENVLGSARARLPFDFPRGGFDVAKMDSTATSPVGFKWAGPVHVFDGETGSKHLYSLSNTWNTAVATDPKKRWVASAINDELGVIKLIAPPGGTPMESLSREDLLSWMKTLTNLRVQKDDSAEFGYKLVYEGVPDWDNPPSW